MTPLCPICGAPSVPAYAPFCSRRCRLIDLGNWLGERYVIPGDPATESSDPQPEADDQPAAPPRREG